MMAVLLAACSGGGSSNSASSGSGQPYAAATQTVVVQGVVAVGSPLVGATVSLMDANGKAGPTATTDSGGNYSISEQGLTAPLLVTATDSSGSTPTMYSVIPTITANSSAPVEANVTPLTTAVVAALTPTGNPQDLTNPATLSADATPTSVASAVSTVNGVVAQLLTANGLSASTFNPITTVFTANQTGADAVLDALVVTPATSTSPETLATTTSPTSTVPVSSALVSSTDSGSSVPTSDTLTSSAPSTTTTTTTTTSSATGYTVGTNPTDATLASQEPVRPGNVTSASGEVLSGGATTPYPAPKNTNTTGVTSCLLPASYFAEPAFPGGPYIPTAPSTPGGTTPMPEGTSVAAQTENVDMALAANHALAPTPWDGTTQPVVLNALSTASFPANGQNVPPGYPTAPDTARIQAALYACANANNAYDPNNDLSSNGVVELAAGPNAGQTAFVTGPLTMPGGVTLVLDKGVTLFASRDPVLFESGTTGAKTGNSGDDLWGTPTVLAATTPPTAPITQNGSNDATVTSTPVDGTYYCGQIYANDNGCNALISNIVYTGTAKSPAKTYTSNNAVMGPGVIDGQGGQPLNSLLAGSGTASNGVSFPALLTRPNVSGVVGGNMSWWDIGWEGNEALSGQDQDNPRIVVPQFGYNFTLFDITLQNAPKIHVSPEAVTGFTAWGLKIFTPTQAYTTMQNYWGAYYDYATVKNTDGFDPELKGVGNSSSPVAPALAGGYGSAPDGSSYGTFTGDMSNILLAYSYINTSDDNVAVKGESSSSSTSENGPQYMATKQDGGLYNMTVAHDHFFYGHGMSIGSQTAGGGSVSNGPVSAALKAVSTPLSYTTGTSTWTAASQSYASQSLYPGVTDFNVYDLALDYTDNGIRIKTNWSEGGLVSNINYTNLCMQGNPTPSTYDPSPQSAITIMSSYSATANAGLLPSYQGITINGLHELTAADWVLQGFNSSLLSSSQGWTGGPSTTIINPLGLTLNNVVADQAPVQAPTVTDANITLGSNISASLGLPAVSGTNDVTVTTNPAISAQPTVDCSQAFANIPGNTDVMTGAAINSPFPGEQFPIVISGQTVPAQQ